MELEERSIEELPENCSNCGNPLTDAEKEAAIVEGTDSPEVLCATCADEQVDLDTEDGA